jgi:hypothetical protein
MATFTYTFSARAAVPSANGVLQAMSAGTFSITLPSGRVNTQISRNGDLYTVRFGDGCLTLEDLPYGPDKSTHWRWVLKVPGDIDGEVDCFVSDDTAEWLINWAAPRPGKPLFINRDDGGQFWLRDVGPSTTYLGDGRLTPGLFTKLCLHSGPAHAGTDEYRSKVTEVINKYYYPREGVWISTMSRCCSSDPELVKQPFDMRVEYGGSVLMDWSPVGKSPDLFLK